MHLRAHAATLTALILVSCTPAESPQSTEEVDSVTVPAGLPDEAPMPFRLDEKQARGKAVYETMCWSCHGASGRGDGPAVRAGSVPPPRDLTTDALTRSAARRLQADFQARVSEMDPDNPHMENVLAFLDVEAFSAALAYLPALGYPPEIPGSAIAGRENYVLRCQGCHGAGGDGSGPAAETLEVAPADFTRDTLLAEGDFEAAFQKIRQGGGGVHGSSMPAWGVMLDDGDVWDLVAYIATFQPGVLSPPPGAGEEE
mgnify:CR=1 FL=1